MKNYQVSNYQNFSYFDQFKEMEIDLSRFPLNFSEEKYKLKFSNLQPVKTTIKNIFEQYEILNRFKRDAASFEKYDIMDGERIENISYKFYNTVDYWWIIAVFNDIKNPFYDMPLAEEQIIEFSNILAEKENKYPQDVYYKLLFEENETKRKINIPKEGHIADVVWEYRQAILKDRSGRING